MNSKKILLPNQLYVASFDVDAQNTFTPVCPDELPVPHGAGIVDELNRQAWFASVRVGSKDAHSPSAVWVASENQPQFSPVENQPNVDIRWKLHAVPGTEGFKSIAGLPGVTAYDYFVWKGIEPDMHPYGACYHDFAERLSTGAIEFLQSRAIETVVVGGLATDYCVKTTALQLARVGFDVVVNLAACRGIAADTIQAAIAEMQRAGVRFAASAEELSQA
jgi:nicotinamidase/pyrazinamidase